MKDSMRYQFFDVLRGVAILLMVIYHFCYDLTYFNFVVFDFYTDPFWLHARTFILSFFLCLVGMSLWLAHGKQLRLTLALRRVGVIAVNAALVSLATGYLFGERVVFFGVLHFVVLASLLGLFFVRYRWLSLAAGFVFLLLGSYENAWFDQSWYQWIGMMTHKPATEDYVPLVPWFGVVLLGIFFARPLLNLVQRYDMVYPRLQPVSFLGQHSLLIYMLHQPIMIGVLKLFTL